MKNLYEELRKEFEAVEMKENENGNGVYLEFYENEQEFIDEKGTSFEELKNKPQVEFYYRGQEGKQGTSYIVLDRENGYFEIFDNTNSVEEIKQATKEFFNV